MPLPGILPRAPAPVQGPEKTGPWEQEAANRPLLQFGRVGNGLALTRVAWTSSPFATPEPILATQNSPATESNAVQRTRETSSRREPGVTGRARISVVLGTFTVLFAYLLAPLCFP